MIIYCGKELISNSAAEAVAKQDKQQREMEKKAATMLRSIAEHREAVVNSSFGIRLNYKETKQDNILLSMFQWFTWFLLLSFFVSFGQWWQ